MNMGHHKKKIKIGCGIDPKIWETKGLKTPN